MAQERTPTPEELWNAYPLDPDQTPAATPETSDEGAVPAPQRGATPAPEEDGGGAPLVPIALVALVACAGAVVLTRKRRPGSETPATPGPPAREPAAAPQAARVISAAAAPAPERFQRREYALPRRPAPPPPPVPGRSAVATAVAPWPAATRHAWRAEIVLRRGERLEVMVVAPGHPAPSSTPVPEASELVEALRDLEAALEEEGWTPVAPRGMHRFVWQHGEPPPSRKESR